MRRFSNQKVTQRINGAKSARYRNHPHPLRFPQSGRSFLNHAIKSTKAEALTKDLRRLLKQFRLDEYRRPNGSLTKGDEQTTSLQFDDIKKLLAVLHKLVNAGNTLVVVEHNLDVIKSADWMIDLGPEGGAAGRHIVAEGRPEQVAKVPASYTGRFLAGALVPATYNNGSWHLCFILSEIVGMFTGFVTARSRLPQT
jgi:hypothetical protein